MMSKALALGTATVVAAPASVLSFGYQANAHDVEFRAKVPDPSGDVVGKAKFRVTHHAMYVDVKLAERPTSTRPMTRRP